MQVIDWKSGCLNVILKKIDFVEVLCHSAGHQSGKSSEELAGVGQPDGKYNHLKLRYFEKCAIKEFFHSSLFLVVFHPFSQYGIFI